MMQINDLGLEVKCGIVFSLIALVFSILAGVAGGVPAGVILLRALFITPVFFGIGFGVLTVIRRYVPEVYQTLERPAESITEKRTGIDEGTVISELTDAESTAKSDTGFTEFTEKDYDRLSTVNDSGVDEVLHMSGGKLGKHIIVENQLNGYEPKLMAQAIRTMMSKDKD